MSSWWLSPVRCAFGCALGVWLLSGIALAEPPASEESSATTVTEGEGESNPHGGLSGHGAAKGGHGDSGHVPSLSDINWFYGMLGEREGVEPSIVYRPTGMPVPLGALVFNSAIVIGLLYFAARVPVAAGLKKRKAGIMQGMDEAGRMKAEAESQLAEYERKLATIDEAVEQVRKDMREAGEAERRRVLADATERRARMERDAKRLIEQELHAAREELQRDVVRAAVLAASRQLEAQVSATDQQLLVEDYVRSLSERARLSAGGAA